MAIYVNGNLSIESFLLQEWKDKTWTTATMLNPTTSTVLLSESGTMRSPSVRLISARHYSAR